MSDLLVLRGGEVLVSSRAVPWVALAVHRLAAALRRDGVRDADAEAYVRAFTEAQARLRTSDRGSPELPAGDVSSCSVLIDPIGTREAERMTNTTSRNISDLCDRGTFGTAVKIGGRWQIERAEVEAYAANRAAS